MPGVQFDSAFCSNLELAARREWLETNGLGGYASGTVCGMHTRRYHGLLMAATKPPAGRALLLAKYEETLVVGGERFELGVNRYPGAVHPNGQQYLAGFRLDPFPVFTYRAGGVEIEKRVFMVHGENTTVVEYEVRGGGECSLEVSPLIAFRDYHSTTHRNDAINGAVEFAAGLASVEPYAGLPRLYFSHNAAEAHAAGSWYFNFEYDRERERGLDFQEDLYSPLALRFDLVKPAVVIAALIKDVSPHDAAAAPALRAAEIARRAASVAAAPLDHPLVRALTAASDQFIVKRGDLHSAIAGYHWFADWGRDTMIALPGLTLATGRFEVARGILRAFANAVSEGMLPNRFVESGETPEYNTVDATLWFFEAIRSYAHYSGDYAFVREHLFPGLKDIVNWHLKGTRYGIRVDGDGLLRSGEAGVQLTWMDAKVGDWVVTPRAGKPVEIQALWYNALCVMHDLASRFGDSSGEFLGELSGHAAASFNRLFWNEQAGCLFDVVDGDSADASIRPNQIFAASLFHSMLPQERATQVVDVVRRELLTPMGLRSLSPRDSRYAGHYEGDGRQRDGAYHQGTVWPWLMGPFLTAHVKTHGRTAESRAWFEAFGNRLLEYGLGQIAEIADGAAPHAAKGCIAQAWSVAELLRAGVEDVLPRGAA